MTGYHDAHLTPDPSRREVWRAIVRYLAPWTAAGHVLEVGAGYCDWINQTSGTRRVAVDIWPELPRFVAPGVEAHVLDIAVGLPDLGASAFDLVLASNILEHFAPDTAARVVRDLAHLLKPGGRLIVIQPNFRYAWRNYFDDYTHRAVFTHVSLPALLRSEGFTIDHVEPRFLPYSMQGARIRPRGWLVSAYLRSPLKPLGGQMLVVARKG